MARIPDSEIERLKKEVPIERLVMGFGVELKRHGAEWIGRCPFSRQAKGRVERSFLSGVTGTHASGEDRPLPDRVLFGCGRGGR